jgi:hypothetical protein
MKQTKPSIMELRSLSPVLGGRESMRDPESAIAHVIDRLTAMAEDPPFRFLETPRRQAERYLQGLKTFAGYSNTEIARAEAELNVRFPVSFRTYLGRMGKNRGELFRGSDVADIRDLRSFRADAVELLHGMGLTDRMLPTEAVVFLFHQGYSFLYLVAGTDLDPPVYQFVEGQREASLAAESFLALLEAEVRLMERNYQTARERGGYWLTPTTTGVRQVHPALNSGERPLDGPHRFVRWWEFWR